MTVMMTNFVWINDKKRTLKGERGLEEKEQRERERERERESNERKRVC